MIDWKSIDSIPKRGKFLLCDRHSQVVYIGGYSPQFQWMEFTSRRRWEITIIVPTHWAELNIPEQENGLMKDMMIIDDPHGGNWSWRPDYVSDSI